MPRRTPGHIPALDSIRGLAVLLVIAQHVSVVQPAQDSTLRDLMGLGWLGVDIFFVLSGFLITRGLLDTRTAPLSSFYLKRAGRILPLYFVLIAFLAFSGALIGWDIAIASTFMVNWQLALAGSWAVVPLSLSPAWSLCVEEHFYAVWPLITRNLGNKRLLLIALSAVPLSISIRLILWLMGAPQATIYATTIGRLDAIGIGAAVAIALTTPAWTSFMLKWRFPALVVSVPVLGFLVLLSTPPYEFDTRLLVGASTATAVLAASVITYVVLPATSGNARPIPGWLTQGTIGRGLMATGRWSYGVYLLHLPVLILLVNLGVFPSPLPAGSILVLYAAVTCLSLLAGALSWRLLERRAIDAARSWARALEESGAKDRNEKGQQPLVATPTISA